MEANTHDASVHLREITTIVELIRGLDAEVFARWVQARRGGNYVEANRYHRLWTTVRALEQEAELAVDEAEGIGVRAPIRGGIADVLCAACLEKYKKYTTCQKGG